MKRPWVAQGRSHEHERNGRVGRRFATQERAKAHAKWLDEQGCWDVQVIYAPVTPTPPPTADEAAP